MLEGCIAFHSIPCALLYAKLLLAMEIRAMLTLHSPFTVLQFLQVDTTQAKPWGDPQMAVAQFGDTTDRVFGEEVRLAQLRNVHCPCRHHR